jgi:hypothetical protein
MTEQRGGDVSENDAEGRPDALDGAEGYEARTGADIGERHAGCEPGTIQDPVGEIFQGAADFLVEGSVAAVTHMEQPSRPLVRIGTGLGVSHNYSRLAFELNAASFSRTRSHPVDVGTIIETAGGAAALR